MLKALIVCCAILFSSSVAAEPNIYYGTEPPPPQELPPIKNAKTPGEGAEETESPSTEENEQ